MSKPGAKAAQSDPGVAARLAAAGLVSRVLNGRSLDAMLTAALEQVSEADRPLVRELASGSVRFALPLKADLERFLRAPLKPRDRDVLAHLLVGAYQIRYLRIPDFAAINSTVTAARRTRKPWAPGLANAVLRKLAGAEPPPPTPNAPEWLIDQLRASDPDHWEADLAVGDTRAPMTLRIDRRATAPAAYVEMLAEAGIEAHVSEVSADGVVLDASIAQNQLPDAPAGTATIQDEGAQLAVPLLASAQPEAARVLDACAAPGGKAGQLLEHWPEAEHTLTEIDPDRMATTQERLPHLADRVRWVTADAAKPKDWWDGEMFDAILVDAPCSGSGSLRRNPDIRLLRRPEDIPRLATTQLGLLRGLWPTLREGGTLLYVTCSVLGEENEQVVERFLQSEPSAIVLPCDVREARQRSTGVMLPPRVGANDGFYFALLRKSA